MISLADYFMGRDKTHAHILGSDLRANASRTVEARRPLVWLTLAAWYLVAVAACPCGAAPSVVDHA